MSSNIMRKQSGHASISDQTLALPKPGEGKRGEDGHIVYLLRQANAALRLKMDRALADFGVTPPQFAVLTMVVAYPGISNADLARLALLTPQTVSIIVANLERADLLARSPHAVHGRIQHLTATEGGLAKLEACKECVRKIEENLVESLNAADEHKIRRWLTAIASA